MSTALKDLYNQSFLLHIANTIQLFHASFPVNQFIDTVFDSGWNQLELKDRTKHIANCMHRFLPHDFETSSLLLVKISKHIQQNLSGNTSFGYMIFPQYIELYGLNHLKESINAIEHITCLMSCEFCVRPFIIKYNQSMMIKMKQWALHPQEQVRRLASEGCRPALPWAAALPMYKKNPEPVIEVLELLKNDPSPWVRKSVANNLNDISKTHPDLFISIAKEWVEHGKNTEGIIKHGARTLLKKGNKELLTLFGIASNEHIIVKNMHIKNSQSVVVNEDFLNFGFELSNKSNQSLNIRLEYCMYFPRLNSKWGKKVFKISEKTLHGGETISIDKSYSFKPITTRKYYMGTHYVAAIVNGEEYYKTAFELVEK